MNLKSMSIDALVGLRGKIDAALTTKVADERRSLESELVKLSRVDMGSGRSKAAHIAARKLDKLGFQRTALVCDFGRQCRINLATETDQCVDRHRFQIHNRAAPLEGLLGLYRSVRKCKSKDCAKRGCPI